MNVTAVTTAELNYAARQIQDALEAAEQLLRENVEHYQGRGCRIAATMKNEHGRVLALVREALDLPAYVPPWEQEAERLNEALLPPGWPG